jgi:hypothetical protein
LRFYFPSGIMEHTAVFELIERIETAEKTIQPD